MNGTKKPEMEHFMNMAAFGSIHVEVTPDSGNPGILHVDIGASERKEIVSMKTNKDETIDQFCARMRSMLRSLANGEPRVLKGEEVSSKDQPKTWEEQKAAMKRTPVEAKVS